MAHEVNISFIGSGNVAWHLAPAFDNLGYIVKEVYSRNPTHAEALTGRLYQAEVKASLDFSTSPSQVFFIATTDEAIADVAREIILPEQAVLVHTSGSQPLSELSYAAALHQGVFYPLQTFSKGKKIDFKEVPIFIEVNDEQAERVLRELATAISSRVIKIGSEQRKALHVAAVFASNFTNHMLSQAKEIMEQNSLDFDWLKPLVVETIQKSLSLGPEAAQTGPARRGDLQILDRHLEFLKENDAAAAVYKLVSQEILDRYH